MNRFEFTLNFGSDIHLKNKEGRDALILAAHCGCKEVVKALIKAGSNLHIQDDKGKTALMYVSLFGYSELAKRLIQDGADIDRQDKKGWTALMRAARQGHFEIVEALIQQGANPLLMNDDHQTAADLVQESGREMMTCYLEAYLARQVLAQAVNPLDGNSDSTIQSKETRPFRPTTPPQIVRRCVF